MKYIISESQYKLLFEDGLTEFPGFDFFGGDLNIVEKLLDNFVVDGKQFRNVKQLLIYLIKGLIKKDYADNNGYNDDDDYGVYIYELNNFTDMILYNNDNKQIITTFYLDYVLVERYEDIEDDYSAEDFSVYYEDLDIETLKQIYNALSSSIK